MHRTENIFSEASPCGRNRPFVRHAYTERVAITLSNDEEIYGTIGGISLAGCCVKSHTDIRQQQNIRIKFAHLEAQLADVIWKEDQIYGIQFRKPLSLYGVEHVLRTACLDF